MGIESASQLLEYRRDIARRAIAKAGGPKAFAEKLSDYTGSPVTVDRINKWRYIGVPCEWAPIVSNLTGIGLKALNPWEHTESPQVIHKRTLREILGLSAA